MTDAADVDQLCQQARERLKQREFDEAAGLFRRAIEIDDSSAAAHEGLAATCFHVGDLEGAIEHFTQLTVIDPLGGKSWINLGAVHNRQGDYEKAVECLRKGLQRELKSSEAYYNLGIAYRNQDQMGMVVTAYREAIRLRPEMSAAHVNLANVLLDMANYGQAQIHYHEALRLKPGLARAEAGLRRAEQVVADSQKEISPFGRLVEEGAYLQREVVTGAGRSLSSVERARDRESVLKLSCEISESAGEVLEQLRLDLLGSLMALNRAIAEGADMASHVVDHQETFRLALSRSQQARKRLRDALETLKLHEQEMSLSSEKEG